MRDKVNIAGVQMEPIIFEKEGNVAKMLAALRTAAGQGAQLIVFPEAALTGYCFTSLEEAVPLTETVPGPGTQRLAAACGELGVYAVFGLLEKDGDRYYNAVALLGPEGFVGKYRKIHLPYLGIDRFLDWGDQPPEVFQTGIGRIGINICYDVTFPETARVMALQGAEIVALSTNWPEGRENAAKYLINARALENRVNYIAVDRVGQERGGRFIGRSKIVDLLGNTLAEAGPTEEEIIYANVYPAAASQKRSIFIPDEFENHIFADRRPELYGAVTEPCNSAKIRGTRSWR
ncbi:MAG: carbon-nitrogen hydrolase family protein [Chloroflexi bacterium]|nr:carbon-nitrogen hydrolase family protein [Chloroflexota bacterium]